MAKKENESYSIKDILPGFLKENNLQKGIDQVSVKEAWSEVMGKAIMSYTDEVKLSGKTLIVSLSSSTLREELSYGKEIIIKRINITLGKDLIKSLRLI
ncbi:MAG: DUF721 domain-containing protein [Flavobacteriia bacterium]|nr:MAG: DUF721 domain-containing protein [Flavobacteriia bacterium]